jgi:N6-L-threonylcarbamoyladenine synthase
MLVAIETSCDETAVAVLDRNGVLKAELVSSQINLHRPYGGVVPELAAREHLTNLPILFERALLEAGIVVQDVSAIAATRGPGLNGCLLVGLTFAKSFAVARGIPFIPVNHLEGHLWAGDLVENSPKAPFLALLVSGGNTAIVLVKGFRDYTVVAETLDDAVGEAFDKVAMMLGLSYPGGPALSRLAATGDPLKYQLPIGIPDDPLALSFSGLKTAVSRLIAELKSQNAGTLEAGTVADVAASVESNLVQALSVKLISALEKYSEARSVLLTGGVAANTRLRERLTSIAAERSIRFVVPLQKWCTDNAAMIGAVALRHLALPTKDWSRVGPLPRWPISELANV